MCFSGNGTMRIFWFRECKGYLSLTGRVMFFWDIEIKCFMRTFPIIYFASPVKVSLRLTLIIESTPLQKFFV